ncbi:unnamed protein product [Citrullus colocynthis]|uniref:Subtilisin inhibitor 1 n=1 Tax=Citrullus colocynthis TaxID=252529 RepID=A0ABP0YUA3_9ROSI
MTHGPEVTGKRCWPELVGIPAEEAAKIIVEENPNVYTIIMPPGQIAQTLDYGFNRVRIFTDLYGRVNTTPCIG